MSLRINVVHEAIYPYDCFGMIWRFGFPLLYLRHISAHSVAGLRNWPSFGSVAAGWIAKPNLTHTVS